MFGDIESGSFFDSSDGCLLDLPSVNDWNDSIPLDDLNVYINERYGDSDDSGISDRLTNGPSPPSLFNGMPGQQPNAPQDQCVYYFNNGQTSQQCFVDSTFSLPSYTTSALNSVAHIQHIPHEPMPSGQPTVLSPQSVIQENPLHLLPTIATAATQSTEKTIVLTPSTRLLVISNGNNFVTTSNDTGHHPALKELAARVSPLSSVQGSSKAPTVAVTTPSEKKLKNRQFAQSSRLRRKEYTQSLEVKVAELKRENKILIQENTVLKNEVSKLLVRVEMLTSSQSCVEDVRLRPSNLPITGRNAATLAVAFLLFTINLAPLSIPSSPIAKSNFSTLRLTSNYDTARLNKRSVGGGIRQPCELNAFVNRTESLRLTNDLNRWARSHKKSFGVVSHQLPRLAVNNGRMSKVRSVDMKAVFGRAGFKDKFKFSQARQYPGILEVFSELPKRNDTFYVLSLLKEYLIVPATAYNKTSRPRMSLIMPAFPYNESLPVPFEGLTMLQIECEVMNTRLLQVDPEKKLTKLSNSTLS